MRFRRTAGLTAAAAAVLASSSASVALASPKPRALTVTVVSTAHVATHSFTAHLRSQAGAKARFRIYVADRRSALAGDRVRTARHSALTRSRTVSIANLPYRAGTYYLRAQVVSGARRAWSKKIYAVNLRPSRPTGLQVHRSSVATAITWRSAPAGHFEIELGTNAALTSGRKTLTLGNVRAVQTRLLQRASTYYVRVRAINGNLASAWSAVVRTRGAGGGTGLTGNAPPAPAPPTSPTPTAGRASPTPTPPASSGTPTTAPTTANAAPEAPASGVIMGAYVDLPGLTQATSMPYREKQLGITYGIDSHYYDWSDPFPTALEAADVQAGRTPMITWWGTDLGAINNGSQDALIRRAANKVKAFGHPVFLRWAAEMNGDWYAWSGVDSAGGPASFVAAWRHIHDIFSAEGVDNVSWVWAPNADSHPGGTDPTAANSWRNYYPGDAYVDWVGIDGYNRGATPNESWQSFGSIFSPVYNDYANRKPIMIAETSSVDVGGDKGAWIAGAQTWMKSHPDVHALVWFDTDLSSSRIDWRADSSPSSWNAMTDLVHDPYFQARAR